MEWFHLKNVSFNLGYDEHFVLLIPYNGYAPGHRFYVDDFISKEIYIYAEAPPRVEERCYGITPGKFRRLFLSNGNDNVRCLRDPGPIPLH